MLNFVEIKIETMNEEMIGKYLTFTFESSSDAKKAMKQLNDCQSYIFAQAKEPTLRKVEMVNGQIVYSEPITIQDFVKGEVLEPIKQV